MGVAAIETVDLVADVGNSPAQLSKLENGVNTNTQSMARIRPFLPSKALGSSFRASLRRTKPRHLVTP